MKWIRQISEVAKSSERGGQTNPRRGPNHPGSVKANQTDSKSASKAGTVR